MVMRWLDLLFAHWPVDPSALRPLVPEGLELDTFDGRAWLGVVPFRMTGVRPLGCPPLPGVSAFAELNVRTYVRCREGHAGRGSEAGSEGKPGVWFFSLDAASRLAVRGARWTFHLPYLDARMRVEETDGWIRYESRRTHRGAPPGVFRARYRPVGESYRSEPGDLDHWLTERYCLYSQDRRGRLYRGNIHHLPWPLRRAEAEIEEDTLTEPLGTTGATLERPDREPLLHFARRLDVVAWGIERVDRPRGPSLR
jgi:uncharacterized protein YqjF (DUF2071 family)